MLDGLDGLRNCTICGTGNDGLTATDIALNSRRRFQASVPPPLDLLQLCFIFIFNVWIRAGSFPLDVNVNH